MNDAELTQLYNKFEKKDMPLAQFRKEYHDLTDPNKIAEDLLAVKIRREIMTGKRN